MEKEQEKLIKAVNAELEEWLCSGDTDYLLFVRRLRKRQNND